MIVDSINDNVTVLPQSVVEFDVLQPEVTAEASDLLELMEVAAAELPITVGTLQVVRDLPAWEAIHSEGTRIRNSVWPSDEE